MPAEGGETSYPAAGSRHIDGPEYSGDGAWIYLNTEEFGVRPGHAQLARVPAAGGTLERLVESDTVDWFPHLSPDGEVAAYISFPTGTLGHPADLQVEIKLVRTADWASPVQVITSLRRPGHHQRQQLVARQPSLRLRRVPHRGRRGTVTVEPGFTALFDGTTLTGWSAIPRSYGRLYPDGPPRTLEAVDADLPEQFWEEIEALVPHPEHWLDNNPPIVW